LIALLATLALAIVVAGPWATVASAADATGLTIEAAEAELVRLMNESRTGSGLAAVSVSGALSAVARARSTDMAVNDYFSHTQADGRSAFDLISAAGIAWTSGGEILAWNQWPALGDSAVVARDSWLESPPHRAVLLGAYTTVGVGAAVNPATGKTLWTALYIVAPAATPVAAPAPAASVAAAPDRTAPWVRWGPSGLRGGGSRRTATIRWGGADTTAAAVSGLRDFQIQVRRNGRGWTWLNRSTTVGRRNVVLVRGSRYEFRVRARDNAGNAGPWIYQTIRI
jgi:hypothetical protein